MATTKALLEASMKRLGSRGAMPDDNSAIEVLKENNVKQEESIWQQSVLYYTAPCDGYFQAKLLSTSEKAGLCVRNASQVVFNMGNRSSACILTRKGSLLAVDLQKVQGATMISFVVQFFKSIGGGLNSFINSVVASLSGVRYGLA